MPDFEVIARHGEDFVVNTTTAGTQGRPRLARLNSDGFVVVWMDLSDPDGGGEIRAQIHDVSGAKVGGEIPVNTVTAGAQGQPGVARLASGGFVVSWTGPGIGDNSSEGRGQIFDATGAKVGGEFATFRHDQGRPMDVTGLPGGGFVIVSTTAAGQVYDALGAAVGSAFRVGGPTDAIGAAVATLTDGRFVVATTHIESGSLVQLFDSAGNKVGVETRAQLSSQLGGLVSLAALEGGRFILGWARAELYPYRESDAAAQIFDSSGNKVGGEIRLNTTTEGRQSDVSFAGVPGGGFLATWTDRFTSTFGQLFDASGARLGGEFRVGYTGVSLALIGSERIVVVSDGPDAGNPGGTAGGVRAQIFQGSEAPPVALVASTTSLSEIAVANIAAIKLSATPSGGDATYSFALVSDPTGGAFRIDGDRLVVADSERLD
ncbi:MAG TPA: hypothetical protein VGB08_06895, partial [Allosphingosinicella sp.]